jgi:APA family basic amino acid/polyamine antiporter
MYGGVSKSAKLNFALVLLKMTLLLVFLVAGLKHLNLSNLTPFMPMGIEGVLRGAALAVFPYVGFDALFTFARESKSLKDTSRATFLCIGIVAFLYVAVMFVACCLAPAFLPDAAAAGGFSPNPQFAGNEASAPLAVLMSAAGEDWIARLIAGGAVLGIFNVLLVLSMGGPRIFRNMAEDGLLPPIFQKTHKGNPTVGLAINGIIVGLMAGFVPFGDIAEMMVLGTLVAFIFVCIGAMRMKLVSPLIALPGAIGCTILTAFLGDLVLKTYCITLPVGLVIYFLYGRKHSRLNNEPSLVYEESK